MTPGCAGAAGLIGDPPASGGPLHPELLAAALQLSARDVLLALEELRSWCLVAQRDDRFVLTASSLRALPEM